MVGSIKASCRRSRTGLSCARPVLAKRQPARRKRERERTGSKRSEFSIRTGQASASWIHGRQRASSAGRLDRGFGPRAPLPRGRKEGPARRSSAHLSKGWVPDRAVQVRSEGDQPRDRSLKVGHVERKHGRVARRAEGLPWEFVPRGKADGGKEVESAGGRQAAGETDEGGHARARRTHDPLPPAPSPRPASVSVSLTLRPASARSWSRRCK